jgi:hypothetical protein
MTAFPFPLLARLLGFLCWPEWHAAYHYVEWLCR